MISWKNLYNVLSYVVPLYVVLIFAYGSVKWWKIFSPKECLGINRFVALFAVPLLSIKLISNNNPYEMNFKFIAADTLQKFVVLIVLFLWCKLSSRGSLEWCITLFSLLTLPNTVIVGIPLLGGMYGETLTQSLMVQLSVIQFIIWFPVLLFLFEYRRATHLSSESEPDSAIEMGAKKNCDEALDELDEETEMGVGVLPNELSKISESGENAFPTAESRSISKDEIEVVTTTHCEPKPKDIHPVASVTTPLILIMVCKKLSRNPTYYSSVFALTWSLISFRWHIVMPAMVANSIKIFSDTGLGMAMFSLGLFMALQPRIIAGRGAIAALAIAMRFIVGPTITAATSAAIGLRGTLLQIAIMQAALPQGIVSFVYAQEHNVHPGILSTAVSFGMVISLPIVLNWRLQLSNGTVELTF